ncbi:hypothetical protein [Rubidibacter lacunae]|nr:hypothetical protein [Rubidibacter lacunae]
MPDQAAITVERDRELTPSWDAIALLVKSGVDEETTGARELLLD